MRRLLPVAAGPLAFALDFQLRYALVPWACQRGLRWTLTAISAPLLLVAILGVILSRGDGEGSPGAGRSFRVFARQDDRRFLAILGMLLNAVFALSIIAIAIPDFYFKPCQ